VKNFDFVPLAWVVSISLLFGVLVYGAERNEAAGYSEAVGKVLAGDSSIQYKARKWVDETNSYEIWYYNGLKKQGFERFVVRIIYRWYPDGDTTQLQREEHTMLYLKKNEAFWLMNQIANHFEGVSKHVEDNYCPDCLVRGRREP
jgi:hypothetical protein